MDIQIENSKKNKENTKKRRTEDEKRQGKRIENVE